MDALVYIWTCVGKKRTTVNTIPVNTSNVKSWAHKWWLLTLTTVCCWQWWAWVLYTTLYICMNVCVYMWLNKWISYCHYATLQINESTLLLNYDVASQQQPLIERRVKWIQRVREGDGSWKMISKQEMWKWRSYFA